MPSPIPSQCRASAPQPEPSSASWGAAPTPLSTYLQYHRERGRDGSPSASFWSCTWFQSQDRPRHRQQPLLWLTVSQALSWSLPGVVETSTKGHLTLPLLNGVLGPGPGLSLTWGHRGCCMVGLLLAFSSTKLRAATGCGNVS